MIGVWQLNEDVRGPSMTICVRLMHTLSNLTIHPTGLLSNSNTAKLFSGPPVTIIGRKEFFYLTTNSTHFIYGYMASDIWLRNILIVRKEARCRHIGYSYRLTARVRLYAPSHIQDSTYHGLCYTSRGALAGTRNSSVGSPHEGSIRTLLIRSYFLIRNNNR